MTDEEIRKDIECRVARQLPGISPDWQIQARAMLIEYRKAVLEEGDECAALLSRLLYYREHDKVCEVGKTEFCTCGLKQVADDARKLLRIRALAAPKG